MIPFILLTLAAGATTADDGIHDIQTLVAAIEALQQPVEDFRCEFEGTTIYKGAVAEREKRWIDANGLFDSCGGVFVWKRGGEMSIDLLHRRGGDDNISTENIFVHPKERKFEHHTRPGGGAVGNVDVRDLDAVHLKNYESPARFFLIDTFKAMRDGGAFATTVTDEQVDGRSLKALTVSYVFKGTDLPNRLIGRYWIDLQRNGHAVRHESYSDGVTSSRDEFALKSFKIGGKEVWMPVAVDSKTSQAMDAQGRPILTDEPTIIRSLYVIEGTMQFNKHPGPEVFTARYRPGAPISDHVRKLKYRFGQDEISPRPTKAETEAMLHSQLAGAEAQKNELVAGPLDGGFNWWALSVAGLGRRSWRR